MCLAKLLERLQKCLGSPSHGLVLAALGFDLHHQRHVVKEHDGICELLPLLYPTRVSIYEISKEGLFKKPLAPLLFESPRLASNYGNLAHPKPELRELFQVQHLLELRP